MCSALLSEARSDDDEIVLPQRCKSGFQVDEDRLVLHESSVEDNEVASTDDVEPENVDEGSESKFRYMNAADVAEALMSGRGGGDLARVRSVDSEDEEERHRADFGEHSTLTGDQGHPPITGTAGPAMDVTLSAGQVPEQSTVENRAGEKSASSAESPVPGSQSQVGSGKEGGGSESAKTDPVSTSQRAKTGKLDLAKSDKPAAPARRVTFRREVNQPVPAVPVKPVKPVIELHVDTDHKPTAFSDFQLDLLSSDSGSAVQKLRQFLENDNSVGTVSLQSVPTAVQPGKAFDSLKYFLSTLE